MNSKTSNSSRDVLDRRVLSLEFACDVSRDRSTLPLIFDQKTDSGTSSLLEWPYQLARAWSCTFPKQHFSMQNRIFFLGLVLVLSTVESIFFEDDEFRECDGCFCVAGSGETCPNDIAPPTNLDSLVPIYRQYEITQHAFLGCDPYQASSCERIPAALDGGACIVTLESRSSCPGGRYSVSTYPGSVQEALDKGLYVTHTGPCGVCSSLQDLASYIDVGANMRREAGFCGFIGLLGFGLGPKCFRNLGLTSACADMWFYNTRSTSRSCFLLCWLDVLLNKPANDPGPDCSLTNCIQCDEDNSGPIFLEYSGRTRRNSGLLANIIRPCSELETVAHVDPCALH